MFVLEDRVGWLSYIPLWSLSPDSLSLFAFLSMHLWAKLLCQNQTSSYDLKCQPTDEPTKPLPFELNKTTLNPSNLTKNLSK